MAAKIVQCAKLKQELPGIDEETDEGERAIRMAKLIGGPQMAERVRNEVSAQAWQMWTDHMLMVVNEYRLDPTSDQSNAVLKQFMEEFLFGGGEHRSIENYVPPR